MKAIKHRDGTITVKNVRDWYYAHSIREIGSPDDQAGRLSSMWGWVNHLREKIWWSPSMEAEFIAKVSAKLHG